MGNHLVCGTQRPVISKKAASWVDHINHHVPSGETLLTISIQMDIPDLAVRLLAEGASVNQRNISGNTPLQVAVRATNEGMVDLLIEHRADVNARDKCGLTPLHLACVLQDQSSVQRLLAAGARPDGIQDGKYYVSTPLMTAAECKDLEIVEMLLTSGANVNATDWWRNTSLLKAVQSGARDIIKVLVRHGADPCVRNRFGGSALHFAVIANQCEITRILVEAGSDVNTCVVQEAESTIRYSPLASAIHTGCMDCFRLLIKFGANINAVEEKHKTPLLYAFTNRAWQCIRGHNRHVPSCIHSNGSTTVDSARLNFALELLMLGADMYPVWDSAVWQIRHSYVKAEDKHALILCIRASGFLIKRDFRVETFFRTLALSRQFEALWLLVESGYDPGEEDVHIAIHQAAAQSRRRASLEVAEASPARYLPENWIRDFQSSPRTLQNLCVLSVRQGLSSNVLYGAERLLVPGAIKKIITLQTLT